MDQSKHSKVPTVTFVYRVLKFTYIGRKEGNHYKTELGIIIKHWIIYWIYNKKVQDRVVRLTEMRNGFEKFRQYVLNQNIKYRGIEF